MTVVRVATAADVPAIAEVFAQSNLHEGDLAAHELRVRDDMARAIARVTVAVAATDVVGALVAWHVADEVTIVDVAVLPARRREGHGRALVAELLAWTASAGERRLVLLEVRVSNTPARALYAALGFEEVNVRRGYYGDGEDAVEMHAVVGTKLEPAK